MATPCIAGAACVSKSALDRANLQAPPIAVTQPDQIEAAGLTLLRVHRIGGGAQFVGKRMRKLDCLHIETVAEDGAPAKLLSASA